MLQSMLDSWNDPSSRHAMIIHFPIVLSLVGVFLALLHGVTKFKSRALIVGAALCFGAILATSFMASQSGEDAEDRIEYASPVLIDAEYDAFEEHEHAGESLYWLALPPLVCLLLTLVSKAPVRLGAGILMILFSLLLAGRVAQTAHLGGEVVHKWGLGVPARGEYQAPAPATESRDDPDVDADAPSEP